MQRTTPPFRADHVGSYLRPAALHEARAAFTAGQSDAASLTAVEDEAIRDVVRLQEDAAERVSKAPTATSGGTSRRT